MSRRAGASVRTKALAKAAEAVARRDAERIAREKAIHAALAEFFQAQDEIDRIRAEAERAGTPFDLAIRDAVRCLDRLGESRTGIAELTGLPLAKVREYLATDGASQRREQPAAPARWPAELHASGGRGRDESPARAPVVP